MKITLCTGTFNDQELENDSEAKDKEKIKYIKCNNKACNKKTLKTKVTTITIITPNNVKKEINICEKCYNKLIESAKNIINIELPVEEEINKEKKVSKPTKKSKKKEETEETTIETLNEETEKDIIEDNTLEKATIAIKNIKERPSKYKSAIENYGEENLRTDYVEKDLTIAELSEKIGIPRSALASYLNKNNIKKDSYGIKVGEITRYGLDRLKKEYIEDRASIDELAERIGIKKEALASFLKRHHIRKNKSREYQDIGTDNQQENNIQNIKKLNIDSERLNSKTRDLLRANEERSTNLPTACRTCAYRNTENNHCWYTMVTNRHSNSNGVECDHYVDIREL